MWIKESNNVAQIVVANSFKMEYGVQINKGDGKMKRYVVENSCAVLDTDWNIRVWFNTMKEAIEYAERVELESDLEKADQKYEAQTMDVEEGTAQ